jgi:CRP/FNR family transcriptional activator FtrB
LSSLEARDKSILEHINPLSACTLERSELLSVPLKVVHELIDSDLSFVRAVAYHLAQDLRKTIEDFKNDRLRTSVERLAAWILLSDKESGSTGRFVMPYGKRVLASQLGMAAENLSRNLASLAAIGVAVRGRQFSITDRTALAELAYAGDAAPARENAPPLVPFFPQLEAGCAGKSHTADATGARRRSH